MDVFHFYPVVEHEVFAQAGYEYVEAAPEEVIIFAPDGFQDKGAFNDLIPVLIQEFKQVGFFLRQGF